MAIEYKLSFTATEIDEKLGKIDTLEEKIEKLSDENVDLTGYATEQWVKDQNYLTEVPEGYAKTNDISGKADKTGLRLGIHTDGLVYLFVDNAPVGTGIDISAGGVSGYVDSENNIILNNLPDGTYTIKYEMEDGNYINIGNLELDNNVYHSVTNNLTNCTSNNSAIQVVQGESYSATITAQSGYELSSVVVTMGGNAVTVTDGIINIDNVTGDIVITAVAEKNTAAEPINFCVINTTVPSDANYYADTDPTSPSYGWISGGRCSSTGANRTDSSTTCLTNYIPVQNGDVVYVKGLDMSTTTYSGIYKSDYTAIKGVKMTAADAAGYLSDIDLSGEWEQFTIDNVDVGFVRLCGAPSGMNTSGSTTFFDSIDITSVNIVVNIKRNGEWLRDTQAAEPTNFAEPNTTNKTDTSIWCNDARLGSGGTYRENSGTVVTNFIPFTGDILYIDGMNISLTSDELTNSISFWDENKGFLLFGSVLNFINDYDLVVTQDADGVYAFDFSNFSLEPADITTPYAYVRLCGTLTGTVDDVVINVKRNGAWL